MHHHIFEEHDARVVFRRIADHKMINFRDLSYSLKREGAVRNNLQGVVDQLVEQGLIERQKAPIRDFDTLYLLENGQTANRTLERLRPRVRNAEAGKQKVT